MKPLLYIGAALMVGAGIYGFVDYKKKEHSAAFKSLYKQEQKPEIQQLVPAKPAPPVVPAPAVTEKKETVVEEKKEVATYTRAIKKKHKKFSTKQFSRAALEKEFEEVPLQVDSSDQQK